MSRQLISSDEAVHADEQHERPCSDCPFARASIAGWLGSATIADWLEDAHGEATVECHVLLDTQCAGLSIYRANVGKLPRNPNALLLPADREHVFSTPMEFMEHHGG